MADDQSGVRQRAARTAAAGGAVVGLAAVVPGFAVALPALQCDGGLECLVWLLPIFVGIPVGAVLFGVTAAKGLRLRRPWLLAVAGVVLAAATGTLAVQALGRSPLGSASAEIVLVVVFAGAAVVGYVGLATFLRRVRTSTGWWAGAALFIGLVVAALVVPGALDAWEERRIREADFARAGVPLVVADIPGFHLDSAFAHRDRPGLALAYYPTDGRLDGASRIDLDVSPPGFAVDCATADVAGSPRATCQDTADGWVIRDIQNSVALRRGAVTVELRAGDAPEMPVEALIEASRGLQLRPVTAEYLVGIVSRTTG